MAFRDWQWQYNDAYSQSHVGHVLVTKQCVYNVLLSELHSEPGNTAEAMAKNYLWLKGFGYSSQNALLLCTLH